MFERLPYDIMRKIVTEAGAPPHLKMVSKQFREVVSEVESVEVLRAATDRELASECPKWLTTLDRYFAVASADVVAWWLETYPKFQISANLLAAYPPQPEVCEMLMERFPKRVENIDVAPSLLETAWVSSLYRSGQRAISELASLVRCHRNIPGEIHMIVQTLYKNAVSSWSLDALTQLRLDFNTDATYHNPYDRDDFGISDPTLESDEDWSLDDLAFYCIHDDEISNIRRDEIMSMIDDLAARERLRGR